MTLDQEIEFISKMPKVELHMHVEGSMEPELMWKLANKNNIKLPYSNLQEIKRAYKFKNLEEFVNVFIQGTNAITCEQDLYEVCMEYFKKCSEQNILHTEVHCDIRTYVDKGLPPEMVINSLSQAFKDGFEKYGITGGFMPCFLRHLGLETAKKDWKLLKPFKDQILAIGLSAIEIGHPPFLFKEVFEDIKEEGIKVIAHAGEEAGPEYIWSAIHDIKVDRIDHGIQCLQDPKLVDHLVATQLPLTVCPQSNISLNIFKDYKQHCLPKMRELGLNVSIHSDDPAHFKAYLNENIIGIFKNSNLKLEDIIQMNFNAIQSSFASNKRKAELTEQMSNYCSNFKTNKL